MKLRSGKDKFELFDLVVHLIIGLAVVVTLYPFINVVAVSFSSDTAVIMNPFMIFPQDFNTLAYKFILKNPLLGSSYMNTLLVTVISSALGIVLNILAAFSLSRSELRFKKFFMMFFIITMLISGGMVPNFILINQLNLYDTLWALILPGCVSAYNILLMKNFFSTDTIYQLSEAAKIDGANEPILLWRVVVPSSLSSIATISLFYIVGHWNSFFNALMYTRSNTKWTLQLLLREIVLAANLNVDQGFDASQELIPFMNVKTATLVITVLPILCVYPFLQKYFVKGVMVGAVKG